MENRLIRRELHFVIDGFEFVFIHPENNCLKSVINGLITITIGRINILASAKQEALSKTPICNECEATYKLPDKSGSTFGHYE